MKTFYDYLEIALNRDDEFNNIYTQAEEAFKNKKYNVAWELIQSAQPANIDQASLKTLLITAISEKQEEFLIDMKKKTRGQQ
jgi:hypothetical protein